MHNDSEKVVFDQIVHPLLVLVDQGHFDQVGWLGADYIGYW